jgi:hypothetical protein
VKRPISLSIVGWIQIIVSIVGAVALLAVTRMPAAYAAMQQNRLPVGVQMLVSAAILVVNTAVGYGVLKGHPWAPKLFVAISVLSLAINAFDSAVLIAIIPSLLLTALFCYLLWRAPARAWFRRAQA